MRTKDERPMDDDMTVGVVPTSESEEPTGSDEDEALREVDLLGVVVNAPKRKERAYAADQVDSLLRAAQEHMDLQTERLHELLAAAAAHDGTINALVAQYGDEADSLREQILSLQEKDSGETAILSERLGQVTAANGDLREEIDAANAALEVATAALEVANAARIEAESKPAVKPEVTQASELLSRAAVLADEHVANAKRSADAIVSQAHSSVSSVTQQAEEMRHSAKRNLAEMVAFLERTLEETRRVSI